MQAFRMYAEGPRFEEVAQPTPGPGEIVVKVAGSGVCHSDLHVFEWARNGKLPWAEPFTLGHEITGWVAACGPGVDGFSGGEAVAVYTCWGCGLCRSCLLSAENYCERQRELRGCGLGEDGGMAAYVRVRHARYLVPLGDLEPRDAAPLVDAGLTPYHAVARSLPLLTPSATVVVIGIGGLGHMALQILRALTAARIIALDRIPEKLAQARTLGADVAVLADEHAQSAILEATAGRKADVVLDFVGAQASVDLARKIVRPAGDLTITGLAGGSLGIAPGRLAWGARVSLSFYGSIADLREVIALAQSGRLKAHTTRFSLSEVERAYHELEQGTLDGRAVICPNG